MAEFEIDVRHFDLFGLVTVQMMGAGSAVPVWLTPFEVERVEAPDFTVQSVAHLPIKTPLRFIENQRFAYCEAGLVAFAKGNPAKRMLVDLARVGQPLTLYCESGMKTLPLFTQLIHLTALSKGCLPLHASAFKYGKRTALASGFPEGGKTSLLLAFVAHASSTFISDDWTYVDEHNQLSGLPLPVTLRGWQLAQLPGLRAKLSPNQRRRYQISDGLRRLATSPALTGRSARIQAAGARLLERRAEVEISPKQLFGAPPLTSGGCADTLFLTLTHDAAEIVVEALSAEQALPLLVQMQMREWNPLLQVHATYQAVFSGQSSPLLSSLQAHIEAALRKRLPNLRVYAVYHPHGSSLEALYQHVRVHLGD